MINRIFYTAAAGCAVAAVVLFSIVAYEGFKVQPRPVDNVYPLHRRIL